MTIALSKLTAQNAQAAIAVGLRSSFGDTSLRSALAADHIRSALYANAALGAEINCSTALHTTRLFTSVRKALDLVWSGVATEHLREVGTGGDLAQQTLDRLSAFGEVVDTGGGFWIGTPLRFVSSGDTFIAIGSVPNAVVKSVTGALPICAGISRIAEVRPSAAPDVERVSVSVSQWLGVTEGIQAWTKRVLAQHEPRMQSGNDIPANQLEIYAPDLLTRTQGNPWFPAQSISRSLEGARLCRPIKSYAYVWERPFYLAHLRFVSGELVESKSVRVEYGLTRRLRFGLRCLHGSSQIVPATSSGDLIELELPLGLPDPEARIAALGWPLPSNPRRTVFHRLTIPLLTEVLGRLAVAVVMVVR